MDRRFPSCIEHRIWTMITEMDKYEEYKNKYQKVMTEINQAASRKHYKRFVIPMLDENDAHWGFTAGDLQLQAIFCHDCGNYVMNKTEVLNEMGIARDVHIKLENMYIQHVRKELRQLDLWKDEAKTHLLKKTEQTFTTKDLEDIQKKYMEQNEFLQKQLLESEFDPEHFKTFVENHRFAIQREELKKNPVLVKEVKKTSTNRTPSEYAMQKEYAWMLRMDAFMPEYMKTNLKNMPNNKGYIWKGISYYGEKEEVEPKDVTTLFEKIGGTRQRIHIYSRWKREIYEKASKTAEKVLISSREIVPR